MSWSMFMNAESLKKYTKQDLRQTANRKILWEISMMIEKNPYMRFNQLLTNMGIVEEKTVEGKRIVECNWNEESVDTLEKVCRCLFLAGWYKENPMCILFL